MLTAGVTFIASLIEEHSFSMFKHFKGQGTHYFESNPFNC